MTDFIFVTEKDFALRAKEVIREFVEGNAMLLRIAVSGPHFAHRDSTPFVRIVDGRRKIEGLMAEISADQKEIRGYFPTDVKLSGRIEFGYASQVLGSLPIERLEAAKLDPQRVDPQVHRVTIKNLGPLRRQG